MKKIVLFTTLLFLVSQNVYALDTVFESINRKPSLSIKTNNSTNTANIDTTQYSSIKDQKFNSALVNLDDAQVELRQELSVATSKYNESVAEKNKAIINCKNYKKEMRDINKKMSNVEKSKKIINKNLQSE